jgi:hypothetical protein
MSEKSHRSKSPRKKRPVTDPDILSVFAMRDKMLESAKSDTEKEAVHMACKGLFGCPKSASAAEKKKCFDNIKSKLEALKKGTAKGAAMGGTCGSKYKMGGRKRRSGSKSRSRSRSKSRSKSKSRR